MIIVVLSSNNAGKGEYIPEPLKKEGVDLVPLNHDDAGGTHNLVEGASGLFITGDGDHPSTSAWGAHDLSVINQALELDVPVLATGQGVFLLNQAFGGKSPKPRKGHFLSPGGVKDGASFHSIYLSPGSKSAAILGLGGFFKVNSRHMESLLDLQRSPRLLASAYSVEDGVIEGLESPEHSWVIGFQANIERQEEAPKSFNNIFLAFLDRVEEYASNRSVPEHHIGMASSHT